MQAARHLPRRIAALLGLLAMLLRLLSPALHTCDHAHDLVGATAAHAGCEHSHAPPTEPTVGATCAEHRDDEDAGAPAFRASRTHGNDACAVCTMLAANEGATADRDEPAAQPMPPVRASFGDELRQPVRGLRISIRPRAPPTTADSRCAPSA